MPGEANAIQAGINRLNEQLRNEQNPVEWVISTRELTVVVC